MADVCVFCQIVAGTEPATVLRTWADAVAFVPLNPVVRGHVLVVPKLHVADASTDAFVTMVTFGRAAEWASNRGRPFNLITSAGAHATQTVFHLHVHYVPRRPGDGLALPWTGQVRDA